MLPCKGEDSWISIVVRNDREWESLCEVMEMPELLADRRFSGGVNRWQHREEIDKKIASWTIRFERKALMESLQKKGIAAAALYSVPDLMEDEHLKARGFWDRIDDPRPGYGTYLCKGRGFTLSKTPMKTRLRAPDLGEHNQYVYEKLLGMSQEEIAGLEKQGIIGRIPVPEVLSRIPKSLPKARRTMKEED
jgi:crotonobetainyl-CoA:carnitine CoA-transferase CaiB-like acyl-CoA transferase